MPGQRKGLRLASIAALGLLVGVLWGDDPAGAPVPARPIDYNRDIRPILSDKCYKCHGPDAQERQAGLRLDRRDAALSETDSGSRAIVPGKPDESELVARIFAEDADLRMPPADSNKKLSDAERILLRQWIREGAEFQAHWAFRTPRRPAVPAVQQKDWVRNPIDAFILARLEAVKLAPSPEADKTTLIRRVTLDLTGLPPTPAEVEAFLADTRADAYERLVDRLLASPRFGERMALDWLDAARYADTHGYHIDSHRDMWRWREWVIDSFNRNLPFDRFTVEQLAGDLLPNPTLRQQIATGFNRNHMINYEGGAIPEEYHTAYIVDRVNTTTTVWMGLTLACCQCHDHKYDPFTQKEFYQLYAFFNNVPENGLDGRTGNAAPFIKAPSLEQQKAMEQLKHELAQAERRRSDRAASIPQAPADWEDRMRAAKEHRLIPTGLVFRYPPPVLDLASRAETAAVTSSKPGLVKEGRIHLDGDSHLEVAGLGNFERTDTFSVGARIQPSAGGHMTIVSRMDDAANFRGWDVYLGDGKVFVHLINHWETRAIRVNTKKPIPVNQSTHVMVTYDGSSKARGVKVYVNGTLAEVEVTHDKLRGSLKTAKPLRIGRRTPGAPFRGILEDVQLYDRVLSANEVAGLAGKAPALEILALPANKRSPEQRERLRRHYLEHYDEPYRKLQHQVADLKRRQADLDKAIPTTMVMQEMPKARETFLLVRGQYDKKGDRVEPAVPEALPPLPPGAPRNRLGLAQWLVHPTHPLTARVTVNRFWQSFFGQGLVKTAEDFGSQGEWPSHPELLDWLALEFQSPKERDAVRFASASASDERSFAGPGAWDVKALVRLIVTSATYRQSSKVRPEHLARDPENRLLARASRLRLPAEFIRDQALAVSGLLNPTIGGPSVYPYQPPGLWEEMAFREDNDQFTAQTYVQSKGADLYRRTMYTFWKRTVPPPTLATFDAPDRETCTVRRARTNTPLQALILLNDPTYVEAARKLAERMMREGGPTAESRIAFAFRLTTARQPREAEVAVARELFERQRDLHRQDPKGATQLLSVGESKRDERLDTAELAAWTAVASALLNLDETITRN